MRKLIIHMDDIGINDGSCLAAEELFSSGFPFSASIITPGIYANNFFEFIKKQPFLYDIGVHSTVTCEWDKYRWTATQPIRYVSSLFNSKMKLNKGSEEDIMNIKVQDYVLEACSQINLMKQKGIKPTHLDNHMWTIRSCSEMLEAYLEKAYAQKKECLLNLLNNIPEGINVLTIHPNADTKMSREMIPCIQERIDEYQLFTDKQVQQKLSQISGYLTTWKQVSEMKQT